MESPEAHETENHNPGTDHKKSYLGIRPESPESNGQHTKHHGQLGRYAGIGGRKQQIENHVHDVGEHMTASSPSRLHPVESILGTGLKRLLQWGIPLSLIALLFPAPEGDGLLQYTLIHLTVVQIATFLFVIEMSPLTDRPWFSPIKRSWLASSASLVAAVVGFSALLTLATSGGARYDPSLQFLQLLSSLDIAWVVAALYLGTRKLWGKPLALILASALIVICVWSIAVYLTSVGFTSDGGWLVDGSEMMRIIIPADTVAAVAAIAAMLGASQRADQRTAQPNPQS